VSHGSTDTVVAGVATTNDDDVLSLSAYVGVVLEFRVQERFGVQLGRKDETNVEKYKAIN
jgi:hypothetical protein